MIDMFAKSPQEGHGEKCSSRSNPFESDDVVSAKETDSPLKGQEPLIFGNGLKVGGQVSTTLFGLGHGNKVDSESRYWRSFLDLLASNLVYYLIVF